MGEFLDPAILGEPVPTSASFVGTASGLNPTPRPASTSRFISSSTSEVEVETSSAVEETSDTPVQVTSTSVIGTTTRTSPATTSAVVTSSSQASPSVSTSSMVQSTSSQLQTSLVITTSMAVTSVPASSTRQATFPLHTSTKFSHSLASTMTRPILTPSPTSTFTPNAPTELLSANSRLSFGEIVGLVAVATVVLGVVGWCVVLGPRRVLRKIGLKKKSKSKEEQLEWEADEEKSDEWHKRASVGAASDWWSLRAPAGALESRMSSVSVGGPGMAGVGAGSRMTPNSSEGSNTNDQAPPLQESIQPERRGTVRSGWFSASMVRGASLLSLGSVLKPEPAVSRVGQGQGGSAGRRFQELYRRERATEMGEHTHAPGTSRVPYPAVKRPSRLGTVPTILVQDATLPSLSSASHVTGRGYDADVERIY